METTARACRRVHGISELVEIPADAVVVGYGDYFWNAVWPDSNRLAMLEIMRCTEMIVSSWMQDGRI